MQMLMEWNEEAERYERAGSNEMLYLDSNDDLGHEITVTIQPGDQINT